MAQKSRQPKKLSRKRSAKVGVAGARNLPIVHLSTGYDAAEEKALRLRDFPSWYVAELQKRKERQRKPIEVASSGS